MKKSVLFASVALFAIGAVSCNKSMPYENRPSEPGYVEVGLSLGGEMVDVSYSDLTKGGDPLDPADSTLYVVSVYGVDSTSSTKGYSVINNDSNLYAHGVFDDISKARLKLLSGKRYSIRIKAIVNGIHEIYYFNNLYDGEHQARLYSQHGHLTNDFFYNGVDNVVDVTDYQYYRYIGEANGRIWSSGYERQPDMDIYYGGCDDLLISQCADIIPIDMYYTRFKIVVVANGLKATDKELICEVSCGPSTRSFSLSSSEPEKIICRSFSELEDIYETVTGDKEYVESGSVKVKYSTKIEGQTYSTTLVNSSIMIPRKKTVTITINVNHDKVGSNSKDFSLTFDNNDISESGGKYTYTGTIKE